MKITLFFIFCLLMQLHAENTYSQTANVNLNGSSLTLQELISEIENQTDYLFIYSKHDVDLNQKLKVKAAGKTVADVLNKAFEGTGLNYKFTNNYISVYKKGTGDPEAVRQDGKKRTVTGRVTDVQGESIIGANVMDLKSKTGTITDIDGNFSLSVGENAVLVVSFIGYIEQRITVKGNAPLHIKLKEDTQKLDEVVVVGYGSMKKSDLTGSVVSLKADDISSPTNSSFVQMMQGRAAGVVVTQSSAQPGGAAAIKIRGTSSVNAGKTPLYVVDGFPIDNTNFYPGSGDVFDGPKKDPLNSINPSDIESMEVLKDASATAIYGSRAANGVILITTKKGKEGKARITFNSSFGTQVIAKRFDVLNGSEFAQVYNEMQVFNGRDPYYKDVESFGKGTDWFKEVTRTGMVTNHDVTMQGGNVNTKYLASGSYHRNDGIVKGSSFERYSFRLNLDQKISEKLNLTITSLLSNTTDNNIIAGTRAEDTGVLGGAYAFPSNVPIRNEEGKFSDNPHYVLMSNPVSLLDIDDKTRSRRVMLNASLNYTPTDYLFFKIQAGTDMQNAKREYYNPTTTRKGAGAGGIASVTTTQGASNLLEATATFKKNFGKHKLDVLAGYTYQDFLFEDLSAKATKFFTDYFGYNNIGIGEERPTVGTTKSKNVLISGIARANYNYDDRYLFTATFRADGSSKFEKSNRFGYFPSFSAAWRISNEAFMKDFTNLSNLKLRIGYGETGNQDIGNNSYMTLLGKGYVYIFGDRVASTLVPNNAGNPLLMWETAKQFNVGVDAGFFDNRISATLEYYQTTTDNLLLKFATPAYSGYASQWRNAGKIQNKGVEFTLNTRNISTRDFQWETTLTVTHNKNLWKDRAGLPLPQLGASEHDPVNAIYGYVFDGIWQEGDDIKGSAQPNSVPGNIRYADIGGRDENGEFKPGPDGKIDAADITYLGTPDPKVEFGFGNDLTYKNWNLNFFFNARVGGKTFNQFRSYYENPARVFEGVNAFKSVMDRWTPTHTDTHIHSGKSNPYGSEYNSLYIENTSFLRLKSVRLTYNTRIGAVPCSVYVDAQNVFTITDYTGYDPEVDGSYNGYPPCRTFMVGLRVSF